MHHRSTEYAELGGTHKDHRVPLLALQRHIIKIYTPCTQCTPLCQVHGEQADPQGTCMNLSWLPTGKPHSALTLRGSQSDLSGAPTGMNLRVPWQNFIWCPTPGIVSLNPSVGVHMSLYFLT